MKNKSFQFELRMILRLLIPFLLFTLLSACQEREFLDQFDPKVPKTLSTSVSPVGSGQITISPSAPNYKTGETVSLTPVPSQHWVFQKWEGDASGTTVPLSLTMDSNKSLIAVFVKKDYVLSITIQGGGTISETIVSSPSGREYPHGTTVKLTPIPQQGWIFESWGGDLSGTDFPKNIFVDKEKNVTAKFIQPAIASLSCTAATNNGLLTAGSPAAGVNSEIPYTGGNGSAHNGQTVTSTEIRGLTATLAPGTFANGSGSLLYTITGTPSSGGTANFAIDIGGQTCTISRTVNTPSQTPYPDGQNKLSSKLAQTVWIGDNDYQPCDCGFSGIIGFDDYFIYEFGEFGSKEPTGCFPVNFWFRDYSGEIKNLVISENKITFNIIAKTQTTWDWLTEIEIVDNKLVVKSSTNTTSGGFFSFTQKYVKSTSGFLDLCKR